MQSSLPLFILLCAFLSVQTPWASGQSGCSWTPGGLVSSPNPAPAISAVEGFNDGSGPALIVAGTFSSIDGTPASHIARKQNGSYAPLGVGLANFAYDLEVFDDGSGPKLHACGVFMSAGGIPANRIASWDGVTWSPLGSGMDGSVFVMRVFDDGTGSALYAGGAFTLAGGQVVNNIARWNGSSWSPLGVGITGNVYSLGVFDDGTGPALYAGGGFFSAGGAPAGHLARWDGSAWTTFGTVTGTPYDEVHTLMAFDDGTGPALYVGGMFTHAGGVASNSIARWDGSSWSPVGGGLMHLVEALAVFDDGTGPALYAHGSFTSPIPHVARWDGAGWAAVGGQVTLTHGDFCVFDDDSGPALYLGGSDLSMTPGEHLLEWNCGSSISLDLSQPGGSGSDVFVINTNLTPGGEYFNLFSLEPCLGGPGSGSSTLLGLCSTNLPFLIWQALLPAGVAPFHVMAPTSYICWGPYPIPPVTLEGFCLGPIGSPALSASPVTRFTVY